MGLLPPHQCVTDANHFSVTSTLALKHECYRVYMRKVAHQQMSMSHTSKLQADMSSPLGVAFIFTRIASLSCLSVMSSCPLYGPLWQLYGSQ